jgi:radical SAM protein with 4Fe4S-binding SPASM domain
MSDSTSEVPEAKNFQVSTDCDLTVKQKNGICLVILPNYKKWVAVNEEGCHILNYCKKGTTAAKLKNAFKEVDEDDLIDFIEDMIKRKILFTNGNLTEKSDPFLKTPERLTLWIHLTHACNLSCAHCDVDAGAPKKDELTPLEIETCIKDALRIAPKGIDLDLTGGEPFLRTDIFEILDRLTIIPHVEISLLTNGTLINEETAKNLGKYFKRKTNLRAIQVSLDGASKDSHEFIRGKNTFEKTLKGINLLRKYQCEVEVACILTELSITEFDQYLEMMARLGVSRIQTPVIKPIGRAIQLKDKRYFCSQLDAARILFNILKSDNQKKELINNLFFSDLVSMVVSTRKIIKCAAGTHALCVESNGDVYPCPSFTEYPSFNLGNIREQSLSHLYETSPIIQQFKELSLPQAVKECCSCEFRYFCGGGCMVENLSFSGDILQSPLRCAERKELIEEMMMEIAQGTIQVRR